MKCICGEEIRFKAGNAPIRNAETYNNAVRAKTECCNRMVLIYPKIVFKLRDLPDEKNEEDDWGFK